jgi:uncharacterized protein (TIGR01777 family)
MKVLITGATGLVGRELIRLLRSENIQINYLTTRKKALNSIPNCKGFYWNPKTGDIDANCIIEVDKVIHLAGATVAQRWTDSYKKEIVSSRVLSTQLLFNLLKTTPNKVNQIVSASATGIYKHSFTTVYNESSSDYCTGFLAEVVKLWESEVNQFSKLNILVSKLRIGLVVSEKGGAISELKKTINYGFGAAIASGEQIVSWIHIGDLAAMFLHVITHNLEGVYNATAPNGVTNSELTKAIAHQLDKPLFLPNTPKFVMRLILGEMHTMVCDSQNVSSVKIESTGFLFKYKDIAPALSSIMT